MEDAMRRLYDELTPADQVLIDSIIISLGLKDVEIHTLVTALKKKMDQER